MLPAQEANLDKLVTAGKLSSDQEQTIEKGLKTMITNIVNGTRPSMGGMGHFGFRRGGPGDAAFKGPAPADARRHGIVRPPRRPTLTTRGSARAFAAPIATPCAPVSQIPTRRRARRPGPGRVDGASSGSGRRGSSRCSPRPSAAGDLRVRQSLGDEAEDVAFARGQRLELRRVLVLGLVARANCWIRRRVIDGSIRASPDGDAPHGGDQLLARGVLEQKAACAGTESGVDVFVGVEGRQDEHPAVGLGEDHARGCRGRPCSACGCPSARPSGQAACGLDRLLPVGRLSDDVDVGLAAEDDPEAGSQESLVVDDQDGDRAGLCRSSLAGIETGEPFGARPGPDVVRKASRYLPAPVVRGPALNVPPHRATRSRMPARPWLPPACSRPEGAGGRAVFDLHLDGLGIAADGDLDRRAGRVLDRVRDAFLDEPVGGIGALLAQLLAVAAELAGDGQTGRAHAPTSSSTMRRPAEALAGGRSASSSTSLSISTSA